ncbi:hypothetical protein O3M35_000747 [Rhynocoris fuscipes]|uniref:Uncharacterized protein n=1 Tax=Rhynocoris fuscipes TaxID=488301 RepID=A0AAW1DMT9_9HEMI
MHRNRNSAKQKTNTKNLKSSNKRRLHFNITQRLIHIVVELTRILSDLDFIEETPVSIDDLKREMDFVEIGKKKVSSVELVRAVRIGVRYGIIVPRRVSNQIKFVLARKLLKLLEYMQTASFPDLVDV